MIHVATIARFAGDGRVWRSFDHLLATGPGRLLLVPVGHAEGNLTAVTDGCPVPWQEVWTVLDAPAVAPVRVSAERLARLVPLAAVHFQPHGWLRDVVPAAGSVPTLTRLSGPEGVRLALLGGGDD